jgi:hypothetical protein
MDCDVNYYDVLPGIYFATALSDSNYRSVLWSDWTQAVEIQTEIAEACGDDVSCYTVGNRWSVIYALCGVTMMLLAANSGLMILGAWSFHARGLAACCGSLCCCLNLAAIITTGVFRYNNLGALSALCTGPSKYDDSNGMATLSDDRTFESDAAVIVALWICQMIFCCTNCCHTAYTGKPTEVH